MPVTGRSAQEHCTSTATTETAEQVDIRNSRSASWPPLLNHARVDRFRGQTHRVGAAVKVELGGVIWKGQDGDLIVSLG